MGLFRGVGRWAGLVLWVAVLAPALGLIPAALLDRGSAGEVRPTLFPAALGVLDPFVWTCVWNSLAVASGVAFGALVVGVGLARIVVRWRFWGRKPLLALIVAPMVIPSVFGALGFRLLVGPWRIAWQGSSAAYGPWPAWVGLVWVGLTMGVPLVALSAISALLRIEPGWIDAARLAGAGPHRVWRQLIWPVVRPTVARAVSAVFTLMLVEPGAPLVLGLRRTLAFQIVEAALGTDPLPRSAVLALLAVGFAVLARVLLAWWGGPRLATVAEAPASRPERARAPLAAFVVVVLGFVALLAWLPSLGAIAGSLSGTPGAPGAGGRLSALLEPLHDRVLRRLLVNSFALGAGVVVFDLALAWVLAAWGRRRGGGWLSPLSVWPEAFPPLTLGIGALALPWLLQMMADVLHGSPGRDALARNIHALADGLDPERTPGLLLVLAVAAVQLPLLARVAEYGRSRFRPVFVEAAINLGASSRRATRMASGRLIGVTPGLVVLTLALAATNLAPALVLSPTLRSRTLSPGALILADSPGDGLHHAAVLATFAIALNVSALALAARKPPGPLSEWFRK